MRQLRLPMPLPEPRQPLTTRQLWNRFQHARNVANELNPGAIDDESTAQQHAVRNHTGSGRRYGSMTTVTALLFAVLLLIGCDDGNSQTVADYWGLNDTPEPTATIEPPSMPTATPTTAPAAATATPTPQIVTVTDVNTQVSADGNQYQIVKGDNLWRIARAALRNSGATWNNSAVGRYVAAIIADNPDTQRNPDLIHPNQVVMLPEPQP